MFGMSAERNEVERPARIAQCGHAPEALRRSAHSALVRKLVPRALKKATGNITESLGQAFLKGAGTHWGKRDNEKNVYYLEKVWYYINMRFIK